MLKRGTPEEQQRRGEEKLVRQQERIKRIDARIAESRAKLEVARGKEDAARADAERARANTKAAWAELRGKALPVSLDGRELTIRAPGSGARRHTIDAHVTAQVETAGNLVRRPTLMRAAAGAVVAGPLGAVLGGAAWKKEDARELYLAIEGKDWAELVQLDPRRGSEARALAQRINLAARQG
jgi:hypothetical protein